jgi:hypothetical protein
VERFYDRVLAAIGTCRAATSPTSPTSPVVGTLRLVERYGTPESSSGDHTRHRLSRAGNRRINRVLHIMAVVQLRHHTEGRRYYRRKLPAGKTSMEARTLPSLARPDHPRSSVKVVVVGTVGWTT